MREIIREEDQNSRVTLLEYLKQLHPVEWDNFVKDTKILAEESETMTFDGTQSMNEKSGNKRVDDLPFYCIGFKTAAPEYTPYPYLGFPACTDALPYCFRHDELLQGHQAPLPCREPADRAALFCTTLFHNILKRAADLVSE